MANQEDDSLPSPHFFKVILNDTLQNGSLELPLGFVKKHSDTLSKYACLQTGALAWEVEVERRGGGVWLHKGWREFVEYYSIKCGYFLVFRYEGESRFRVFIFDTSTSEIRYPVGAASTSRNWVELDRSRVVDIEDDDDDDDDDEDDDNDEDDEYLLKLNGSKEKNPYYKQSSEIRSQHTRSAWDKALQKAKAFKTPNPCFLVRMQRYHVAARNCYLYIPESHGRTHFLGKENNGIYLKLGEDGRTWFVKYYIFGTPRIRIRLMESRWGLFKRETHLQIGDVCVFELVNSTTMTYKVTVFRIADYA